MAKKTLAAAAQLQGTREELTANEVEALRGISGGADIYGYGLAHDLRSIERKMPELLEICPAMKAPKDGAKQQPYFGAISTAAGKRYANEFKG